MASSKKLVPMLASVVALLKVGGAFLPPHHPSTSTSTATAPKVQALFTTTTIDNVRQQSRRHCGFRYVEPPPIPSRSTWHHCGAYSRIRDLGRFHYLIRKGRGYSTTETSSAIPLSAGRTKGQIVETDDAVEEEAENIKVKNDQEWQFFDTARINVKAGMGGNG